MEEIKPIEETNKEEKAVNNSVQPQKNTEAVKRTVTKKPVVKKEVELPASAPLSTKIGAAVQKPVVEIIAPIENDTEIVAIESGIATEEKEILANTDKLKNNKIKKPKKMSTKLTEKEKKEKTKKKQKLAVAKSKQKIKEKKAKKKKKEKAKKEKAKKKLKEKTAKKKAAAKKKKAKSKKK